VTSLGWSGRLAAWSAAHRWQVVAGWLLALIVVSALAARIGGVFTTEIEFTNSPESQTAKRIIERVRGSEPLAETVVVRNPSLTVDDPAFKAQVEAIATALRTHPDAIDPTSVTTFYESGVPQLVSQDRHTTLVPALLTGTLDQSPDKVQLLQSTLQRETVPGFTVLDGGYASVNDAFNRVAQHDLSVEEQMLPLALAILVIVFGAVVAALVPMAIAFVAIFVTFGAVTLISQMWPLSTFVQNMVLTIGLAVGIDYALFVIARFREERRAGRALADAIAHAGDTATRAVVFSGATVVIALSGMLIVPTSIFRSFGVGAALVVVCSVAISLTLLPAILALLGDRVNALSIPFVGARRQAGDDHGFWATVARSVMAHPIVGIVLPVALLVGLSVPYFSIRLGQSGPETFPASYQVRQAFDILNREFSAGMLAPTNIVVTAPDVNAPPVQQAVAKLVGLLQSDPQINVLSAPQANPAGDVLLFEASVPGDVASNEAIYAVARIRDTYVPQAFAGVDARALVGGATALDSDFFALVHRYTPITFAFVLGFSFLLLLLAFRSIVVPLKAIVMNLLSVGAAYGVVVGIFQEGWLTGPLWFQHVDKIEAWLPIFMFTVLFGLSMDYHVFLLSRIRERFDETHRNTESVAYGVRTTANIITGAAAIMVAVFAGFSLGQLVMFQELGVGLAVAVFLDATVVRTVLVPASMRMLGDWNWYLPSWLEWLPDLRVDRQPAAPGPRGTPAS
jgi:RND superfamily putative drug exporter